MIHLIDLELCRGTYLISFRTAPFWSKLYLIGNQANKKLIDFFQIHFLKHIRQESRHVSEINGDKRLSDFTEGRVVGAGHFNIETHEKTRGSHVLAGTLKALHPFIHSVDSIDFSPLSRLQTSNTWFTRAWHLLYPRTDACIVIQESLWVPGMATKGQTSQVILHRKPLTIFRQWKFPFSVSHKQPQCILPQSSLLAFCTLYYS